MKVKLLVCTVEDSPLIERWLHADHVRRWWGEPDENTRLLDDGPQRSHRTLIALIEADGRKVGLVLCQHPSREELDQAGLGDVPTSVVDIDIMIGEPEAIGRGVGQEAIRLVVERTLEDETVPYLIAATMIGNVASLRAFQKAGFRVDREFDDPVCGRCILMVRPR